MEQLKQLLMEHALVLILLLKEMVNDHSMMDSAESYVVVVVGLLGESIGQVNELIQNGEIGVINIDLLHRTMALLN